MDAVIIATQEWQRVTPSIHACQAGKDVYAEKPLTLCIHEGRVLVNAVRKHDRVFQVGSQQRSMALNRIACEAVRTGVLGKLIEVRAPCYPGSGPSPADVGAEAPTPAGLDWGMWLNQAAWRPFNAKWGGGGRDFTGGEMTNWGAHGVDQIQWGAGMDGTGPVEMWPTSPGINGKVEMRYANGLPISFSLDHGPWGGAIFICEKGKLEVNRNKFASNPKDIAKELLLKVDEVNEEKKWSDRLHSDAEEARGRRGDRPSVDQHLPFGEHHPLDRRTSEVGSGQGRVHRQRCGQQVHQPSPPQGLRVARNGVTRQAGSSPAS
jgi:predicted dehydrogenase